MSSSFVNCNTFFNIITFNNEKTTATTKTTLTTAQQTYLCRLSSSVQMSYSLMPIANIITVKQQQSNDFGNPSGSDEQDEGGSWQERRQAEGHEGAQAEKAVRESIRQPQTAELQHGAGEPLIVSIHSQ